MSGRFPDPYYDDSPAGQHSEGHRVNRARFADIMIGFYHWTKKRMPSPGAQNYAFETMGLTEFTPIGASVSARMHIAPIQPPQLYVNGQMVLTTGIGGVAAGQMALQPLTNPYRK